jgi:hypothetical protein
MKKTVRFIAASLSLYAITLLPHMAVAYSQCPARFDALAVAAYHAVSFATVSMTVAFAVLAAKGR